MVEAMQDSSLWFWMCLPKRHQKEGSKSKSATDFHFSALQFFFSSTPNDEKLYSVSGYLENEAAFGARYR